MPRQISRRREWKMSCILTWYCVMSIKTFRTNMPQFLQSRINSGFQSKSKNNMNSISIFLKMEFLSSIFTPSFSSYYLCFCLLFEIKLSSGTNDTRSYRKKILSFPERPLFFGIYGSLIPREVSSLRTLILRYK